MNIYSDKIKYVNTTEMTSKSNRQVEVGDLKLVCILYNLTGCYVDKHCCNLISYMLMINY